MGLARDLAPIRANAVCLGLIMSEQVEKMGEGMIKSLSPRTCLFAARRDLRRGRPKLTSTLMRASYVTGQIVRVDGGRQLGLTVPAGRFEDRLVHRKVAETGVSLTQFR